MRKSNINILILIVVAVFLSSCATKYTYERSPKKVHRYSKVGVASYYGEAFAGRLTANGERFDPEKLTAAHRTLPFGTILNVTNLQNNESVVVRINDRGPFVRNRVIDLSKAAARKIGMISSGIAEVRLEFVGDKTIESTSEADIIEKYEKSDETLHLGDERVTENPQGSVKDDDLEY